jgi:Ca-activated chloride channel family protein
VSALHFADPQWANALWGVLAFVALLFWLERRSGGALDRLVSAPLQGRLVRGPSAWRRRARIVLLGLAAAFAVVALMRPQLGVRHVASQRVGAEIMLALDVSKSMLAEDVAPNRLERAKAEIVDLLGYLDGDQVGLIAFAGRATVLAPMTPDFGFLRLVLEGAGPHSVTRGGTRLEEPIRKAVEGFGPPGEAGRAILLITDGEDHDSFPLDAAAAAAEAGIVIIAVGFGDENGSEISVTNPRTGARELVRDGDGRPVRSRLDGELLRDLALATGGAYVPAGTGVLDLESIYRQYVERLTAGQLDPRGRTVRDEAYQWAVLLALVLLVSSVAVTGSGSGAAAAIAALALLAPTPDAAWAQGVADPRAGQPSAAPALEDAALEDPAGGPGGSGELDESAGDGAADPGAAGDFRTAREIFNDGVRSLEAGDVEAALSKLERSRREAAGDSELRFRAAYDLGIANARHAEQLEADSPEAALRTLYVAADWFRDAIRLRPEDEDARVNLEVALRRALLVADRMARADTEGVDERLAEIAERQRGLVGAVAALLQAASEEPQVFADDRASREFRDRATEQRVLLADSDELAGTIDAEREALASKPEAERGPEEAMRAAQLEAVLGYIHRGREKMGQTRRQLRQSQAERAYRRGSAALGELKRALDQLRDPAALLDALIRDASEVAAGTAMLAASRAGIDAPPAPAWLGAEALAEAQFAVAARTDELDRRLLAGLESEPAPEHAAMLAAVREAEPFVARARADFEAAAGSLTGGDAAAALASQRAAVLALADARERFLALRGLIEVTYADERRLLGVLADESEAAAELRDEYLPSLRELQIRNVARGERLEQQLEAESARAGAEAAEGSAEDPEAAAIERQRTDLASQLLTLALGQMDSAQQALGSGEESADWPTALAAGKGAVKHLEALRRLYFSIAEQLRETAREQLDLGDDTRDAAALADADPAATGRQLGPLPERQRKLGSRSGEIAAALEEQSNQSGGVMEEEADGYETSRRLRLAGEHVLLAQNEMDAASAGLAATPPDFAAVHGQQVAAVAQLEEALALLVPPEDRERGDESQQQEQSQQAEAGDEGEKQQSDAGAAVDPAQLLQAVRDREAQRRRERQEGGTAGYETVEKDW